MSIWNEDSGYYCLLIAIFCEVNVTEAKLIYKYGPAHPVSRRIFRKKIRMEGVENMKKETIGNAMYRMRKAGYTLDEISNVFGCYPSTVKRRIEKEKKRKEA
ncbi:hypothetical protein [Sporofaciens musculi]|jgi:hypothetical protein|uniref:hypothetical protein n=1 Tax=Sporofaciens musculi TaxID=2681861 RepID=UPI002570480D|nr:hypothetical protein [Sporofaciens musculi]MCI8727762.1 hypothetical protein [Hungatella sp.]